MLAMPSAFLFKESSAEIFARAAIMLLHSITRPVREPASRSDDTKRRQDMTLDWSTYRTPQRENLVQVLVLVLAVVVLGLDLLLLLLHWLWHLLFLGNTSVPRCRSMTPRSSLCAAARLRHDHRAQRRGTPPRKSIPPRMQGAVVGTAIKGTCGGPFVARGGGEKMRIIQFCVFEVVQVAHQ